MKYEDDLAALREDYVYAVAQRTAEEFTANHCAPNEWSECSYDTNEVLNEILNDNIPNELRNEIIEATFDMVPDDCVWGCTTHDDCVSPYDYGPDSDDRDVYGYVYIFEGMLVPHWDYRPDGTTA